MQVIGQLGWAKETLDLGWRLWVQIQKPSAPPPPPRKERKIPFCLAVCSQLLDILDALGKPEEKGCRPVLCNWWWYCCEQTTVLSLGTLYHSIYPDPRWTGTCISHIHKFRPNFQHICHNEKEQQHSSNVPKWLLPPSPFPPIFTPVARNCKPAIYLLRSMDTMSERVKVPWT